MQPQGRIYQGMLVRDAEGRELGKVVALGRERFLIERGSFFREDYTAPYSEVQEIQGLEVRLASTRESLTQATVPVVDRAPDGEKNDFPWPQDHEEEETLPAASPLEERPPSRADTEPEWGEEITQKVYPPPGQVRYDAAATSTDEPVDGPDIDTRRRF